MSIALPSTRRTWKKPPLIKRAWLRWTLVLGFAVYLALAFGTTNVNWARVWEGLPRGAQFEVEAILGNPVRRARELDVAVPTVEALYALVAHADAVNRGERSLLRPEDLPSGDSSGVPRLGP